MSTRAGGRSVFPLPPFPIHAQTSSRSPRVRARFNRTRAILQLSNLCVAALNSLSVGLSTSFIFSNLDSSSSDDLSSTALRVHAFIFKSVSSFWKECLIVRRPFCERVTDFHFSSLPSTLLSSILSRYLPDFSFDLVDPFASLFGTFAPTVLDSFYSSSPSTVVPLRASCVSLPPSSARIPMLSVLPSPLAEMYSSPSQVLVPSSQVSYEGLGRPSIGGSRSEYVALIRSLASRNMLVFSSTPKCVNGIFCVKKEGASQRLIINATRANRHFIVPPTVALPTPHHLASLVMPSDADVFVAKSDLADYYHNILLPPWMWEYFALPAVRAVDVGCDAPGVIHPCLVTLAMGWSHSVVVSQHIHWQLLATPSLSSLSSWATNASLLSGCSQGVYVDDLSIFGVQKSRVVSAQQAALAAYQTHGFPVKHSKLHPASSDPTKVLGVMIDGHRHLVYPAQESVVNLIGDTLWLLHRHVISGNVVERLVGRWTWFFLVRRPALSIFRAVYSFARRVGDRFAPMWKSVRLEFAVAIAVAPLLFASLDAPFFSDVLCTDASSYGAGVVAASVAPSMQLSAYLSQAVRVDASAFVRVQNWRPIISHRFRRPAHINALELEAILLGLRWVMTRPFSFGRRLLCLSDSKVATSILAKGRTSGGSVVTVCRRICAHLLASGIVLSPCWIPTDTNPADELSRW